MQPQRKHSLCFCLKGLRKDQHFSLWTQTKGASECPGAFPVALLFGKAWLQNLKLEFVWILFPYWAFCCQLRKDWCSNAWCLLAESPEARVQARRGGNTLALPPLPASWLTRSQEPLCLCPGITQPCRWEIMWSTARKNQGRPLRTLEFSGTRAGKLLLSPPCGWDEATGIPRPGPDSQTGIWSTDSPARRLLLCLQYLDMIILKWD